MESFHLHPVVRRLVAPEEPDPSPGPHRSELAASSRAAREGHPRLQAQRHRDLVHRLEVATDNVTDACYERHGKAELLDFMKQVTKAYPRRELHVVLDDHHTHKHAEVQAWLDKNPRITLHFTPTSGSWMNMVEIFFADRHPPSDPPRHLHQRQGTHDRDQPLHRRLDRPLPPIHLDQDTDEILPQTTRQATSDARHELVVEPQRASNPMERSSASQIDQSQTLPRNSRFP
jgi:hypothetical protein